MNLFNEHKTLFDYHYRNIPEYYDTMYQDGYKPWEIKVAHKRMMEKQIAERKAEQAAAQAGDPVEQTVKFKGEVYVNGKRI